MLELQRQFYSLIRSVPGLEFNPDEIKITFSEAVSEGLKDIGITTTLLYGNLMSIDRYSLPFRIFKNPDEFFLRVSNPGPADLMIFNPDKPISYIAGITYIGFQEDPKCYLVTNALAFIGFLQFLKEQVNYNDDTFYFIDYYDKVQTKIVLTSLSDKGRVIIKYDEGCPDLNPSVDYRPGLEKFKKCVNEDDKKHFLKFLKNSMIDFASSIDSRERIGKIFTSLDAIIEKAKVNFEVYLNNLSIDKFKKDYEEVRSRYFEELSKILSELTQKILGLPLGIAASLYALENVKNNPVFLYVLIVLLLVTTGYVNILLKINFNDLVNLAKAFNREYRFLITDHFFQKCPKQKPFFKEIKKRFFKRLHFLIKLTDTYFLVLNISNILLFCYIFYLLKMPFMAIVIIALALLLILSLVRIFLLDDKKE